APVLGDPALEEVLLFAEVDRLAHPGEGVAGAVLARQTDSLQAAIGDEVQVLPEEVGVQPEDAAWQTVTRVGDLQLDSVADALDQPLAEVEGPQLRVLGDDAVDQVDPEVEVDRLVAQDVLELLADPLEPVLAVEG